MLDDRAQEKVGNEEINELVSRLLPQLERMNLFDTKTALKKLQQHVLYSKIETECDMGEILDEFTLEILKDLKKLIF